MIEYLIFLPKAINILLQIVQGIICLYEEDIRHCDLQIQSSFITPTLS